MRSYESCGAQDFASSSNRSNVSRCACWVVVLAAAIVTSTACVTHAGPNKSGTLVIHNTGFAYTDGDPPGDYYLRAPVLESHQIVSTANQSDYPAAWLVLAMFHPDSSPRLSGVTFGIAYDRRLVTLVETIGLGDFELPDNYWPRSHNGTGVSWDVPQTGTVVPVYTFAGYTYYSQPTKLELVRHRVHGALFGDDKIPANIDPILGLGSLGFNGDPGYVPVPLAGSGACCTDLECTIETAQECADRSGNYRGDESSCDPDPCLIPILQSSWGEVKARFR